MTLRRLRFLRRLEASEASPGIESRIFIAALAFRLVSALIGYAANVSLPHYQDQGFSVFARQDHPFWDAFARYDSGHYHAIASRGYAYGGVGRNNLAFFPAYPLLMRAGGSILGGRQQDYYFAGILISWLAFAAAMTVLYRLALLDLPRAAAVRAICYAAVFPFAYFFGMVYSESLYLLALVTAVYALRTRRWLAAAAAGAVVTATRVTGITAAPGLAWLAWTDSAGDASTRAKALLAVSACLVGIGAYSAFNASISPSPFTWYDSITFWNYHPGGNPFGQLGGLLRALLTRPYQFLTTEAMAPYDTLNASAALLCLALVPFAWKRFNGGYALIVLAALLVPLSSGQFEGLGRYSSVQFPIFLALASVRRMPVHVLVFTIFAMLYVVCLSLFVTVHPLF
jgi:Gpi18-like mannosyltransferase